MKRCSRRSWPVAGFVFLAASCMVHAGNATNTAAGIQTLNWTAVPWDIGNPAPNGIGDIAGFVMNGNDTITLDASVILGRMYVNTVNAAASGNFLMSRSGGNTITFDNTSAGSPASVLLTRVSNDSLQRQLAPNLILNSDLIATWGRVQNRVQGLTGIISGAGRLSLNYAIAPTEGPDTGASVNLNGTGHIVQLGTAGDAPSTYTGGTDLRAANATFTTVRFQAKKVDALGTGTTAGRLFMHQAALDLNTFNQTVGGLSGGTGSSKINDLASGTGTTTLTLDFSSSTGPWTFAGVIQNTGTRTVGLTKSGTGTQILTGANTFSGPLNVNNGLLLINGSANNVASVGTSGNGTLGGTGSVGNAGTTMTLAGDVAPGTSIGTLTLAGAVTMTGNYDLETDASGNADMIKLTAGTLDISGATLNLLTSLTAGNIYRIAQYPTGALTSPFLSVASVPGPWVVSYDRADGLTPSGTQEIWVEVPEPSALGLLALAGLAVARRRRRA